MIFNIQLALRLARDIAGLYTGRTEPTFDLRATDTQVLIQDWEGAALVLFPGTASVRDVLTDLCCAKTPFGAGRAHAGFVAAFQSIAPRIIHTIGTQRVFVAGHSLGGALATLFADRISPQVVGVYTFGSPRVYNGRAARDYNARLARRTFRVVNSGDPVAHIPWMLGTYRHVHTRVYLNAGGGVDVAPSAWREVSAQIQELVIAQPKTAAALTLCDHHGIESYIRKLAAASQANHRKEFE